MSNDEQHPPTLDDRPPDEPTASRLFGSGFPTAILTAIVLTFLVAFALSSGPIDRSAIISFSILGVATLSLLIFLSVRWYSRPAMRGYAIGLWIGMGIALLIEGTCFLVNKR